jgi:hypothetical protein
MKCFFLATLVILTVMASAHAKVTKPGTTPPLKEHKSPIVIHPLNSTQTTTTITAAPTQSQPDFGFHGHGFSGFGGGFHR